MHSVPPKSTLADVPRSLEDAPNATKSPGPPPVVENRCGVVAPMSVAMARMPATNVALVPGHCDRRYVDAAGVHWCVRERRVGGHGPALYFESTTAFRRVRRYPDNWRDLGDNELELLSLKT